MTLNDAPGLTQPAGPLFLILSGPSGVGKDATLQRMQSGAYNRHFVVTATTRPRRANEQHGVDYYFLAVDAFLEMRNSGGLLEHANVYGNWYGVPKQPIEEALREGRDVIIKTDVQGVRNLRRVVDGATTVFLAPPSLEELERRLRARQTEPEEHLQVRLATARVEMEALPEFDYAVVNHNDSLDETVAAIEAIMTAERYRIPPRRVRL